MQPLIQLLRESRRILVVAHVRPDGDAVASLLTISLGLQQLGKEVFPVLVDGVPRIFQFVGGSNQVVAEPPKNFDLLVTVDTNEIRRTGIEELVRAQITEGRPLAVIDHHPKADLANHATALLHDEDAASCAELVYQILLDLGVKITPEIATATLLGLFTDTGGFQYSNTTTDTLDRAAELMRRGANLRLITQKVSQSKTLANLKLIGLALERLFIIPKVGGSISVITHEDIVATGATVEDSTGIISNLNVLEEASFSLLISENELGVVRGTIRSNQGKSINVGHLAELLGGGGHARAAGFVLPGHIISEEGVWKIDSPQAVV